MLKRTLAATLVVVTALAVMLVSMSGGVTTPVRAQGGTAAPTVPPTPTAIVSDAGSGGVQLVFWNGLTGSDGTTLVKMTQQFVKENPDISVHTEMMDWGVFFPKLQASLVAGNPPDIFLLHIDELPEFAKLGVIQSSDALFDDHGGPLPVADYSQPVFGATTYNGKRYGVLLDNHGWGTWVNTDLFKKANIDPNTPPANEDAFVKMAQKLTIDASGKTADQAGFDVTHVVQWGTSTSWQRMQYRTLLYQFGGQIVSSDGKTAMVNSDASKKALQMMYDWVYKYHIAPPPAGFNEWDSFVANKLAIVPNGTWFRNFLVDQHPDIHWAVWPAVQWGDKPAAWMNGHIMFTATTESGDKLKAVQRYMEWVSNHGVDWAASGMVPARQSQVKALDPKTYLSNSVIGNSLVKFGQYDPANPNELELVTTMEVELSAMLANQETPAQAADNMQKRMQAVIDQGS